MNYQNAVLPGDAKFILATPLLTEKTVPLAMQARHMAPVGKCGRLCVLSGALQFVWEDTDEVLDADPAHPVIIFPERYHHVQITGPVQFRVEFYATRVKGETDRTASRPGEVFLGE